jgi:hypothetical protein
MSQNIFIAAIGGYVLRGDNPIFIKNYDMAIALFKLQDDEYSFRPVIHSSANVCTSCEG